MNDQEEPDELQKVEYTVLELQNLSELKPPLKQEDIFWKQALTSDGSTPL